MLADHLYPELRAIAPHRRAEALRAARHTPFEVPELLAMAAGLVFAAAIARGSWLAIALGSAIVATFLLRRVRRGLRQLEQGPRP